MEQSEHIDSQHVNKLYFSFKLKVLLVAFMSKYLHNRYL